MTSSRAIAVTIACMLIAVTQPLPAIIYLHGAGGMGTDNLKQITGGNSTGTHVWVTPQMQARHAAFAIAPQMAPGNVWDSRRHQTPGLVRGSCAIVWCRQPVSGLRRARYANLGVSRYER